MQLCLRLDLDYVPWDNPDAETFGHGEPAVILRLLELARQTGYKYHFFSSNRVLRAFPSVTDAVLDDGHHLDWLCKHPETFEERYSEASKLFSQSGADVWGLALRSAWPEEVREVKIPTELKFISCEMGWVPEGLMQFPVETRHERDALKIGQTRRVWTEAVKAHIREQAMVNKRATIVFRPQVMAKIDPKLQYFKELAEFGLAIGFKIRTLREQLAELSEMDKPAESGS